MNNENQPFEAPPQPPPVQPVTPSHQPSRAALFAIIPGIGAVYNREYVKAVVHLSVFAGLVIIAESVPIFSLLAFSFYVYTIIDSYRSAEQIARRAPGDAEEEHEINLPLWGGTILLMGVLFLLDNLGAIRLRSAFQFWPILLIGLGGYLIWKYIQKDRSTTAGRPASMPAQKVYTPQPETIPVPETKPAPEAEVLVEPEKPEGENQ
jgi:hypothetical protein